MDPTDLKKQTPLLPKPYTHSMPRKSLLFLSHLASLGLKAPTSHTGHPKGTVAKELGGTDPVPKLTQPGVMGWATHRTK